MAFAQTALGCRLLFPRRDVGNRQIPVREKDLEAALLLFLIGGLVGIELFDQRFLVRIGGGGERRVLVGDGDAVVPAGLDRKSVV